MAASFLAHEGYDRFLKRHRSPEIALETGPVPSESAAIASKVSVFPLDLLTFPSDVATFHLEK